MAKIDVIIPVYNVEKYLERCMESVLHQTFRDFNVLLVDDGSTDRSGELCDKYAEKYSFIRVIHKENGGASDARNRGLEESGSEYIAFIDSDDFVDPRYLETLYGIAKEYDADLAICDMRDVLDGQGPETAAKEKDAPLQAESISKAEAYRRMFIVDGMSVVSCAKLFRRKLFRNVRYPVGEISEDSYVIPRLIENCGRIACTRYAGYFYVRRRGSLWHQGMTPGHWAAVRNAKSHWDFIRANYPQIEDAAKVFYLNNCIQLINFMVVGSGGAYETECRELRREVLKQGGFFLFSRYTKLIEKGAVLCLLPGIPFYRLAWRAYLRLTGKDTGTMT